MSPNTTLESVLARISAPAAIGAACIGIPGDLYHFTIDSRAEVAHTVLFKLHGVLLVTAMLMLTVALAGFAVRLGNQLGRSGLVVTAAAYVGTVLVAANIATEAFAMPQAAEQLSDPAPYWLGAILVSYGLFAAGWLGIAVVAARRTEVRLPAVLLLGLGAVYAFGPFPGSYLALLAGVAAVVVSASVDREGHREPVGAT